MVRTLVLEPKNRKSEDAIQFSGCDLENFDIGSTNNPLIDMFVYSHHLSA